MTRVTIVLGTRPEIIKMSPVIRALQKRNSDLSVLHTGQHYSYNMDRAFFEQLQLPLPNHNLHSGSGSHGEETARILVGIEKYLAAERPEVVLVEGDTNSVLAGSLAAAKLGIRVGHVEAGLRSYDRRMPEEINRIVADHVSNLLFAPTKIAKSNLLKEGVKPEAIEVTGNTIVDALKHDLPFAMGLPSNPDTPSGDFTVMTLHRQENVDDKGRLKKILTAVSSLGSKLGHTVIYPIHPRTKKRLAQFGLKPGDNIKLVPPLGYFQFIRLVAHSKLALTDSGGVQEEACVLRVPCVTIRDNTERPETLNVGSNMLAGPGTKSILQAAQQMLRRKHNWRNPFGDGQAGERIAKIVVESESG
jgi:UDP-N-acetylglucosamine 2-epimerase (non-hydrolysing)